MAFSTEIQGNHHLEGIPDKRGRLISSGAAAATAAAQNSPAELRGRGVRGCTGEAGGAASVWSHVGGVSCAFGAPKWLVRVFFVFL